MHDKCAQVGILLKYILTTYMWLTCLFFQLVSESSNAIYEKQGNMVTVGIPK